MTQKRKTQKRKTQKNHHEELSLLLEATLNAIPDVIGIQDAHHGVIRYNTAGYRFLGLSQEEVAGRKCYELIGRTLPCEICATSLCYQTLKPARVEKYVPEMDIWLDVRAYPVIDHNGRLLRVVEHLRDITEQKKNEELIRKSLREKAALLQEIHHRVKNNLAIISSLLRLQAREIMKKDQVIHALDDSVHRINAMALIHNQLYECEPLDAIRMDDYLRKLAHGLHQVYHSECDVSILYKTEDIRLDIKTALPCGLLFNEMMTNAFRHAFSGRQKGTIRVGFSRGNKGEVVLTVRDDGIGLPEGFDPAQGGGLGFNLMRLLTEQLQGTFVVSGKSGTGFRVVFKPRNGEG
ncbi:PAS domain S-box protein [bacterium]|nr:PAS domain S-box protein [bacterium]